MKGTLFLKNARCNHPPWLKVEDYLKLPKGGEKLFLIFHEYVVHFEDTNGLNAF